jgi:hypothetical protein
MSFHFNSKKRRGTQNPQNRADERRFGKVTERAKKPVKSKAADKRPILGRLR